MLLLASTTQAYRLRHADHSNDVDPDDQDINDSIHNDQDVEVY